jgi:hypothetical protein
VPVVVLTSVPVDDTLSSFTRLPLAAGPTSSGSERASVSDDGSSEWPTVTASSVIDAILASVDTLALSLPASLLAFFGAETGGVAEELEALEAFESLRILLMPT